MTLKVVFRRAARAEFDGAALWYEERQSGLGMQFTSEASRILSSIALKLIESWCSRFFMRDEIRLSGKLAHSSAVERE
jgi:hypothetical protein